MQAWLPFVLYIKHIRKCITQQKIIGNPHSATMSSVLNSKPEERAGCFVGWPLAGRLSCLAAQKYFTVLFFGGPGRIVSNPVMLVKASVFPQTPISQWPQPSHWDFGQMHCFCFHPSKTWDHPGRLPDKTVEVWIRLVMTTNFVGQKNVRTFFAINYNSLLFGDHFKLA